MKIGVHQTSLHQYQPDMDVTGNMGPRILHRMVPQVVYGSPGKGVTVILSEQIIWPMWQSKSTTDFVLVSRSWPSKHKSASLYSISNISTRNMLNAPTLLLSVTSAAKALYVVCVCTKWRILKKTFRIRGNQWILMILSLYFGPDMSWFVFFFCA